MYFLNENVKPKHPAKGIKHEFDLSPHIQLPICRKYSQYAPQTYNQENLDWEQVYRPKGQIL